MSQPSTPSTTPQTGESMACEPGEGSSSVSDPEQTTIVQMLLDILGIHSLAEIKEYGITERHLLDFNVYKTMGKSFEISQIIKFRRDIIAPLLDGNAPSTDASQNKSDSESDGKERSDAEEECDLEIEDFPEWFGSRRDCACIQEIYLIRKKVVRYLAYLRTLRDSWMEEARQTCKNRTRHDINAICAKLEDKLRQLLPLADERFDMKSNEVSSAIDDFSDVLAKLEGDIGRQRVILVDHAHERDFSVTSGLSAEIYKIHSCVKDYTQRVCEQMKDAGDLKYRLDTMERIGRVGVSTQFFETHLSEIVAHDIALQEEFDPNCSTVGGWNQLWPLEDKVSELKFELADLKQELERKNLECDRLAARNRELERTFGPRDIGNVENLIQLTEEFRAFREEWSFQTESKQDTDTSFVREVNKIQLKMDAMTEHEGIDMTAFLRVQNYRAHSSRAMPSLCSISNIMGRYADRAASLVEYLLGSMLVMMGDLPHFELLYCVSRDGCDPAKFAAQCHHKGPTVSIVRDTDGNIFGGYNPMSMSGGSRNVYCENAFLFSLVSSQGRPAPRKFNVCKEYYHQAVQDHPAQVAFGGGNFKVSIPNCTSGRNSLACGLQKHFDVPNDYLTTAGDASFEVSEMEIFSVR